MVLSSNNANTFTLASIDIHQADALQQEVDLTERAIRFAGNKQRYGLLYNAMIVGNPIGDIHTDDALTALQIAYRDTFIDGGYLVARDPATGCWSFSWAARGIEGMVSIYSIRTTVTPGAIAQGTINILAAYFQSVVPRVTAQTILVNQGSGGDIAESDFGATSSVFYEYTAVVQQQTSSDDLSNDIRNALVTSSLGYIDVPSNVFVYKLV